MSKMIEKLANEIQNIAFNCKGKKLGEELHNHFKSGAISILEQLKQPSLIHQYTTSDERLIWNQILTKLIIDFKDKTLIK